MGSFFGAPHARFSIRPPLQRNLYWESYMQDSLLDLLYKGISTGSPTCRVLYYICSIMESLLEVIHAGFSITPAIYIGISIGTPTCRILFYTSSISKSLLGVPGPPVWGNLYWEYLHTEFSSGPRPQRNLFWDSYMQDSLFNFLYKAYYVCKVISVGTPIRRFPYVHMAKGPHALMPMHPDGRTDMHACVLVGTYLHRYDDLFLQKFTVPLSPTPPKKNMHI